MKTRIVSILVLLAVMAGLLVGCAAPEQTASGGTASTGTVIVRTTTQFDDDSPFSAPAGLAVLSLIAALACFAYAAWKRGEGTHKEEVKKARTWAVLGTCLSVAFLVLASVKVVPVTYEAIIRQAFPVPSYRVVGPGTHFAWPLVSNVRMYTTRIRQMKVFDISADTNSSGRPQIFPDVVVWFRLPLEDETAKWDRQVVREDLLRQLDWNHGPRFESGFLLEMLIASVKEVSGAHEYGFFGSERDKAQEQIQSLLEEKLGGLITVTDFTISTFSYTSAFEERLELLSQKQMEIEQAQRDVTIAEQRRLEALKQAETKKAQGEGQRDYDIAIAQGKAREIELVAAQLAANPQILGWKWIEQWDGKVPTWYSPGSEGGNFLFQVPMTGTVTVK